MRIRAALAASEAESQIYQGFSDSLRISPTWRRRSRVREVHGSSERGPLSRPSSGQGGSRGCSGRARRVRAANVACRGLTSRRGAGIQARNPTGRLCWAGRGARSHRRLTFSTSEICHQGFGRTCGFTGRLVADSMRGRSRGRSSPAPAGASPWRQSSGRPAARCGRRWPPRWVRTRRFEFSATASTSDNSSLQLAEPL